MKKLLADRITSYESQYTTHSKYVNRFDFHAKNASTLPAHCTVYLSTKVPDQNMTGGDIW